MEQTASTKRSPLLRWAPGIGMLRSYRPSWLRYDLVAGIVLAAILVPQGMAYAELAGVPAVNGLYTTIACLVGYAIFGPSRILVLGPDSSVAPLIFAAIVPLMVTDDPAEAVALAGMMALMVGAIEVGLGLGKLGFVADLLSKEVQVGYMNGLAITIIVGQLPKLFGFSTDADGFVDEVTSFLEGLDQTEYHGTGHRPGHPGSAADPSTRYVEDSRGARCGRRRDGGHRRPRPGRGRCRRRRCAAAGAADACLPLRPPRHSRGLAPGLLRHRPRVTDGHDRHID